MSWTTASIPPQNGRKVIVTGANSGIGYEAARVLAEKGARVLLACRNQERADAAAARIRKAHPDAQVEVSILDLASLESVKAFAERYRTEHGALDILINNAGVMVPPFGKTTDGFELQFGCNHLGHFALTGLLFDLITQSPEGRVVNVSSTAHKMGKIDFENLNAEKGYRAWGAYGQSKLANLLFTYELHRRATKAGLSAKSLAAHPGWAATNLQKSAPLVRILNPIFAQNELGGALPTLRAATDPDAGSGTYWGPGGFGEMKGAPVKVSSTGRSHSQATATQLWSVSEKLTGIPFDVATTAGASA